MTPIRKGLDGSGKVGFFFVVVFFNSFPLIFYVIPEILPVLSVAITVVLSMCSLGDFMFT